MSHNYSQNIRDLLGDTSAQETDYPPLNPNEMEVESDDLELEFAVKPKKLFVDM
jgi:hypothetical protein